MKGNNDSLEIYLKEIAKYPLLNREEEKYYVNEMIKGNSAAKEKLIVSNLRFVVNIAKKYQGKEMPFLDIIEEGNIGLMNAINKFDVDKGYHFVTYAVWWIRQGILRAMRSNKIVHIPPNKIELIRRINKLYGESSLPNGAAPDIKNIAEYLGLEADIVKELIQLSNEPSSLDRTIEDEESESLVNFVRDNNPLPEELVINNGLEKDIMNIINNSSLKRKEKEIIEYRFGLNGKFPHTLEQTGELYNLTRERIRQIQNRALNKLRKLKVKEKIASYLYD